MAESNKRLEELTKRRDQITAQSSPRQINRLGKNLTQKSQTLSRRLTGMAQIASCLIYAYRHTPAI